MTPHNPVAARVTRRHPHVHWRMLFSAPGRRHLALWALLALSGLLLLAVLTLFIRGLVEQDLLSWGLAGAIAVFDIGLMWVGLAADPPRQAV